MTLNEGQEKAVRREKNVVVTAGAGSGKTSVLALRYLRLIKEGKAGVENILTLTFTKKAAAEMYERIHRLLAEEKDDPVVQRELMNFENAQISTIDSFCSRIVKNDPGRYGLAGSFSQDTEEADRFAQREALHFILEKRDCGALDTFILRFGFEQTWKGLFASLAAEYFTLAREHDFTAMAEEQKTLLETALEEGLASLEAAEAECLALGDTGYKSVKNGQEALAGRAEEFKDLTASGEFEGLAERAEAVRVKKSGGKADVLVEYGEVAERSMDVLSRIVSVARTLAGWGDIEPLFSLCGEFQEVFLRHKREAGFLTFRDVATMALDVLLHNLEVRRFYKDTFRYIMIDEFQDNNGLQKDILYLLAERKGLLLPGIPSPDELEPDKLFFVGDQKQSIYRFRGADVSVIKELAGELEGDEKGSITLSKNYRSEPALINFFNRLFERVMEGAEAPFEAEFSPLEARPAELQGDPRVTLFYKPYDKNSGEETLSNDDAEAFHLARYIRDTVESRSLQVSEDGNLRPAEFRDFAVLMRSTSNQIRYEKMFRLFGVPYVTQDVRALFLEAPVNDLYAALECAAYPEDRTALAAFLRSPFVNISDEGFVRVLLETETVSMENSILDLEDNDKKRYERGRQIITELRERMDKAGIVSLVYYLWYDCGYRYIVLRRPSYHGYLEYFEYLREYAHKVDRSGMSTAAFLDEIRPRLGNYEKLSELTLLRSNLEGVQLMTIHKSKGLQFPIVVVANLGNAGRAGMDGDRSYYLAPSCGVAFHTPSKGKKKKNYFYESAKDEEKARDVAELKRLLYVAATRARHHLIFSGCHNHTNRKKDDVLLNMLFRAAGIDPENPFDEGSGYLSVELIEDVTEDDIHAADVRKAGVPLSEVLDHYDRAEVLEYLCTRDEWSAAELNEIYVSGLKEEESRSLPPLRCDPVLSSRNLETDFGTYCHRLIEHSLSGSSAPPPSLPPLLATLPSEELELVRADAAALVRGFLEGSFMSELPAGLVFHSERLLLYRYTGPSGPVFISTQPDLCIESPEENIIVDFKSDRFVRKGQYAVQMALYKKAAEALNGMKTRVYLYYLRSGDMDEAVWDELEDKLEEILV